MHIFTCSTTAQCNSVIHCLIIDWTSTIGVNNLESKRSGPEHYEPFLDLPTDLVGVVVEVDVLVTVVTVATAEAGTDVIEPFVMVDVVGHILPVM